MGNMLKTVKGFASTINEFWPMVAGEKMIADRLKSTCTETAATTAVCFFIYIPICMFCSESMEKNGKIFYKEDLVVGSGHFVVFRPKKA